MRKNVKQQLALRVLSTAALMAMVSSIATAAFADTYDLNTGSVTVETKDDGFTYVTQLDNTQTDGYARNDKDDVLCDYKDTTGVTITSNGKQTENTITVDTAKDQTTDVTLQDVNIKKDQWDSRSAAMTIKGEGDTEIELNGDNTLISGNRHAGLEKADDVSHGSLTIKDDLNNDGTEKEKDESGYSTGGNTGTLKAAGGFAGAGIGGRKKKDGEESDTCAGASNITITGGTIKAGSTDEMVKEYPQTELGGAGIGGAAGYGNATNITITGNADVTAAGGYYSAGIGGGEDGNATNITISGNAKVAAAGSNSGGAGIGGGDYGVGKNIRITDHADVTAYGGNQGAGIGGGGYRGGSVEISGNAKVFAKGANGSAGIGSGEDCRSNRPELVDTSVTISENAEVMAVGSYGAAAIGNGVSSEQGKTTVTITGGTVTAIGGESSINYWNGNCYKHLASAIGGGNSDKVQDVTVTINGTTGNTTVNASCWLDQESAISTGEGAADIIGYDKDGKSPFGEDGSVIVRMYNHGSYTTGHGSISKIDGDLTGYTLGTLYQTVHNRKYMDESPDIDTSDLKDEDLHDWKLVGKVVEPTLEKDGYADYICSIDKCGQTKHVVLPKIVPDTPSTPETPDTPDTPDTPSTPDTPDVPSTPEVTPADPAVTPDAPVQDAVPDTAPADAAVTPAAAQNVVQDAKPEAAATAAVSAAALPQTGANWLAVVGSALSGLFLLAAGFVLDRKGRRMN